MNLRFVMKVPSDLNIIIKRLSDEKLIQIAIRKTLNGNFINKLRLPDLVPYSYILLKKMLFAKKNSFTGDKKQNRITFIMSFIEKTWQ
ncbi:MAG: hypothetical protein ACTHJ5_17900 [Ilyomonas sp.]